MKQSPCFSTLLRALLARVSLHRPSTTPTDTRPGLSPEPCNPALKALMLSALALPCIAPTNSHGIELESTELQYGHYLEGGRAFWSGPSGLIRKPQPLTVDSLQAQTALRIDDTAKIGLQFSQDVWSGATPYITSPEGFIDTSTGASAYVAADKSAAGGRVDRNTLTPLNLKGNPLTPQPKLINLMTSASAETRNQVGISLQKKWETAQTELRAGMSDEPDYQSQSLSSKSRWEWNDKLSSISIGLSAARGQVNAYLGPVSPYVDYDQYTGNQQNAHIETVNIAGLSSGVPSDTTKALRFKGDREDFSASLGFSQVLSKNTVLSSGLTYTYSQGFLESPHKLVLMGFANPNTPKVFNYLFTTLFSMPENRPDQHHQLAWNTHLAHYLPQLNAAWHNDYTLSQDDWGVQSHAIETQWVQTFENGWTITPRVRYYSQEAADFYQPYFIFRQAFPKDPNSAGMLDFSRLPIQHWSSDQRLSAFGARSIGLTVSKQWNNQLKLNIGLEDYKRSGSLKLGGGGEGEIADLHAKMLNVALQYDFLPNGPQPVNAEMMLHHPHDSNPKHLGMHAPTGVMNAHMLTEAGDWMISYQFGYSRQGGSILHGSSPASDQDIVASCGSLSCPTTPKMMSMQMQMLHIMYAVNDRINLMVMPQYMSMTMNNRLLEGGTYTAVGGHNHDEMDLSGHSTGGLGDTTTGILLSLLKSTTSELHAGIGVSIPTGSISEKMFTHGGELMDYGMQLGSGTWDFLPSLTYNQQLDTWSWGAQVNATIRPDHPNKNGYTLGNQYQGTLWASKQILPTVTASLRGLYTHIGGIQGMQSGVNPVVDANGNISYPKPLHSSTDIASNYGGDYWDMGLGMTIALPSHGRTMQHVGIEWMLPMQDQVEGYQLQREGALLLDWSMMF